MRLTPQVVLGVLLGLSALDWSDTSEPEQQQGQQGGRPQEGVRLPEGGQQASAQLREQQKGDSALPGPAVLSNTAAGAQNQPSQLHQAPASPAKADSLQFADAAGTATGSQQRRRGGWVPAFVKAVAPVLGAMAPSQRRLAYLAAVDLNPECAVAWGDGFELLLGLPSASASLEWQDEQEWQDWRQPSEQDRQDWQAPVSVAGAVLKERPRQILRQQRAQ